MKSPAQPKGDALREPVALGACAIGVCECCARCAVEQDASLTVKPAVADPGLVITSRLRRSHHPSPSEAP